MFLLILCIIFFEGVREKLDGRSGCLWGLVKDLLFNYFSGHGFAVEISLTQLATELL